MSLPHYVEQIRDRLAENIHEIWAMNKIDEGWRYGEERDDDYMLHPCLTQFERLPPAEKRYDVQLALQTLKYGGRATGMGDGGRGTGSTYGAGGSERLLV